MEASWREDVRDQVQKLALETFTLADIYAFEALLAARHPANSHVRPKIRQVLQQLRDRGEIDFVAPGKYRLLSAHLLSEPETVPVADLPEDAPLDAEPGTPDSVPLENLRSVAYVMSPSVAREAVRREQRLVLNYAAYLEGWGHQVSRHRIPTKSSGDLWTDLHDETDHVLYEGKSVSSRDSVRLAIGQLYDYQRYVNPAKSAVLLPLRPSDDMCELLVSHQMGIAFRHGDSFGRENLELSNP